MSARISEQFHLTSLEGKLEVESKTSDSFNTSRYNSVTVVIDFTNVDTSISGSIAIQHSPDGNTWVTAESGTFLITEDGSRQATYSPIMEFTRIVLSNTTNSATVNAAWVEAKS